MTHGHPPPVDLHGWSIPSARRWPEEREPQAVAVGTARLIAHAAVASGERVERL